MLGCYIRFTREPGERGESAVARERSARAKPLAAEPWNLICGLEHVRETIPFARMLHKIYP